MKNIILLILILFVLNEKALSAFRTLEADYITNVFSQSNFVKNPNARVNTQNVTASAGFTVARSITTPLYDMSEFLLSSTGTSGTIDWATRTLDAGMKGQNCEARFTYRGFTGGTTKAQIVQGANTVATLDLLASTDPKQVSINFPCGDLTQSTVFRINRTVAAFSGTNEIGGIYLGLATNMANVAQAEFVGDAGYTTTTGNSISFSTASATMASLLATTSGITKEQSGSVTVADTVSGSTGLKASITNPKAGSYYVSFYGPLRHDGNLVGNCTFRLRALVGGVDITPSADQQALYQSTNGATEVSIGGSIAASFPYSGSGTLEFEVVAKLTGAGFCRARADGDATRIKFTVHRFPTSSELVVKPETQNVWGGVVYQSANQTIHSGLAAPSAQSPFTNATWNYPAGLKGKAQVTTTNSGNDLGFSVQNLPTGSYKLDVTGMLNASQSGSTTTNAFTQCSFKLVETTTSTDVAKQISLDHSYSTSGSDETRNFINAFSGIFSNTSAATRNFRIEAIKTSDNTTGNLGVCQAFAGTYQTIALIITPLDQPSNSSLYVQGPVLGAQTGAVIPSGYVGESKKVTGTIDRSSGTLATYVDVTGVTFTVEAGTWLVCTYGNEFYANTTTTNTLMRMNMRIRNVTDSTDVAMQTNRGIYNVTHSDEGHTFSMCAPISVTSTKTLSTQCSASADIGSFTFGSHHCAATMSAVRLN